MGFIVPKRTRSGDPYEVQIGREGLIHSSKRTGRVIHSSKRTVKMIHSSKEDEKW